MGKQRGRGKSRAWGYGGVAIVAVLVIGLSTAALTTTAGRPESAGSVPERPRTAATKEAAPESLSAWTLEETRAALAGDANLVISILGDSTGVGPDRWVRLYARHLGERATVTLHNWTESTQAYAEPMVFGSASRQIEIWNGSYPGAPWDYAVGNLEALQPVTPDLVIGNYGHNLGSQGINSGYSALVEAMQAKAGRPVALVATIQNPSRNGRAQTSAAAEDVLAAWVDEHDVPSIDVRTAFGDRTDALLLDDVHPNPEGSLVWVGEVIATLG